MPRSSPAEPGSTGPPRWLCAGLAVLCAAGCGSDRTGPPEPSAARNGGSAAAGAPLSVSRFEEARAWTHLERIVAFGPRPAGSPSLERLRGYLESELAAYGLETRRESFRASTPIGELAFCNLIAELPGTSERTLVLGSHMDTKRLPFHFVGANDGGSSTALLLELARVLAQESPPRPVSYRFVFFDGEEAIRPDWSDEDSLYGSRHHVAELERGGDLGNTGALVLFDLVADADLQLERDTSSNPELLRLFLDTAAATGHPELFSSWRREILDDHLPFVDGGIPAIDLIDLTYGPYNRYWHSPDDVLENCSAASLGVVGRLALAALPRLEAAVLKP